MNIIDFSVDALSKHQLWYATLENYTDEITLCRPTTVGFEPYNKATAYRMFNGRTLIGFDNVIEAQSQNGIVSIGQGTTEYISTQPYERIKHICEIAPPNDQFGTFTFVDSQPVLSPTTDWRCDAGRYGPSPYPDFNGNYADPISEKSVLLEYEPILSVPGIAHLIYLRRSNFEAERNEFLNNATTQMATATLPEMFVLLNEWSKVANEPFNNAEEIAQDAKSFLSAIHFNESIIAGYPSMQIARFIEGDSQARQRPNNPLPINTDIELFIKTRSSHLSLASLLSTDRGLWDVQDIAELEQPTLYNNMLSLHNQFFAANAPDNFSVEMFEKLYAPLVPEGQAAYIRSWIKAYIAAEHTRLSLV